jgi:hypothetical protein
MIFSIYGGVFEAYILICEVGFVAHRSILFRYGIEIYMSCLIIGRRFSIMSG